MKNKIAFDIDGCCLDIMGQVRKDLFNKYDIDMDFLNCPQYDCICYFDIPIYLFERVLVKNYNTYYETPIYDGVEDFFHLLYEKTKDPVQFVTARHKEHAAVTYFAVDRFMKDIPYQIAFAKGRDKYSFIVGRYEYFFEDRRRTALDLMDRGVQVIMPQYSYNKIGQDWPNLIRVESIKDLIPMIDRFVEE